MAAALLAKGVRISIGGCGCCGSPWVAVEVDGELLVGASTTQPIEDFAIDMFEQPAGATKRRRGRGAIMIRLITVQFYEQGETRGEFVLDSKNVPPALPSSMPRTGV